MAYAGACIGGSQTAPDPDLLSNLDLNSGEVRAGRHLWMTGSISVKGTLIDKHTFQSDFESTVVCLSVLFLDEAFIIGTPDSFL